MKIKSIVFKNIIDDQLLNLTFGQFNLIVGPRGGGKSTLFDLIAASQIDKAPKETLKFLLDSKHIKPEKVIYENGEEKFFTSLVSASTKDIVDVFFATNQNIISQKDISKSGLDSTENIVKERKKLVENFVENLLSNSALRNDKFRSIFNFIRSAEDFSYKSQSSINWNTLFKITSTKIIKSLVTSLAFESSSKIRDIKKTIELLESYKEGLEKYLIWQSKMVSSFESNHEKLSQTFMEQSSMWIENDRKQISDRLKVVDIEIKRFKKQSTYIEAFELVLKNKTDEEKKKDFSNKGIEGFKASAEAFFSEVAKSIKKSSIAFDELMNTEINLEVGMEIKSKDGLLTYKCVNTLITNSDESIHKLLSKYLYTPSGAKNDFREWLKTTCDKGMQASPDTKFDKEIAMMVLDTTKVFADGKDYENMSPGEKSIFGIKYKLANATGDVIFIDQPEDNLDNHSISDEILPLLIKKKEEGKQIFVVTHNANIGVLTKPERVIVANISSNNFDDIYINTTPNGIQENPKAYYLEGGFKKLEERFNILDSEEKK